jgi:Stress responsive A/B Barrel Domain
MLVHSVYIWLKKGLSSKEQQAHFAALKGLAAIEQVRQFHLGVPSAADRPVIERGYSFALIVAFDDMEALETYRADARHQAFKDIAAACWEKQIVYDSEEVPGVPRR